MILQDAELTSAFFIILLTTIGSAAYNDSEV